MKERDTSIDILRGLAILVMIGADMAAYNYAEPHPFLFRAYGSLAAPMFIFLSGMMVSYTASIKAHSLLYYLKRAGATLLVASLIDIFLWDIIPFVTFDVLYTIALSMPLIFLYLKISRILQVSLIVLVFGLTPILQYYLGYIEVPADIPVFSKEITETSTPVFVWKQFLIDGWFPFFPWIGVALSGAFVGSFKLKTDPAVFHKKLLISGAGMLALGIILWLIFMPETFTNEGFSGLPQAAEFYKFLITRESYSELFYPPTLFFIFTFLGIILLLIPAASKLHQNGWLNLLTVFGRSSLLAYMLHIILIVFFYQNLHAHSGGIFLLFYLSLTLNVWLLCYFAQLFKAQLVSKRNGKPLPFLVNFILGG